MSEDEVAGSAEEAVGKPVVIEVTVSAPIQIVWTHLREPDLIRLWHGWLAEELDSEIDYIFGQHARETGTPYVLEIDRGSGDGTFAEGGDRFELHESDGGTTPPTARTTRISPGPCSAGATGGRCDTRTPKARRPELCLGSAREVVPAGSPHHRGLRQRRRGVCPWCPGSRTDRARDPWNRAGVGEPESTRAGRQCRQ